MKTAKVFLILFALSIGMTVKAQDPVFEFVMELRVKIDQPFSVGKTPKGQRTIIPITGGTFEGPKLKGEILSGGADYQLSDEATHRTEVEAIYCIRTDDGVNIHVRNWCAIAVLLPCRKAVSISLLLHASRHRKTLNIISSITLPSFANLVSPLKAPSR